MSSITDDLLAMVELLNQSLPLPAVREVLLPDRMLSVSEQYSKHDKFGLVVLEDGSCGLFYRLLEVQALTAAQMQRQMQIETQNLTRASPDNSSVADAETRLNQSHREIATSLSGKSVCELAALLRAGDDFSRGIGLGVINALTQYVYKLANFSPAQIPAKNPTKTPTNNKAAQNTNTNVGMVGYFSRKIESLLNQGLNVVVLELDKTLHTRQPGLLVSGEPATLDVCSTIHCTASTLINQSLDQLLDNLAADRHFELVGPSASCFPDPLFARNIDVIGSSFIVNSENLYLQIQQGEAWQSSVEKYSLTQQTYPGFEKLLAQAISNASKQA